MAEQSCDLGTHGDPRQAAVARDHAGGGETHLWPRVAAPLPGAAGDAMGHVGVTAGCTALVVTYFSVLMNY